VPVTVSSTLTAPTNQSSAYGSLQAPETLMDATGMETATDVVKMLAIGPSEIAVSTGVSDQRESMY
jgi:hypothetical protein